jgi:phosphoglycolate phosphatase-like HAD superfamily hydrolase
MNLLEEDTLSETVGIILWDIDGTLISLKRNSNIKLHQKVLKDLGFGLIEPEFETQGVTDWEILNRLLLSIKYRANHNEMNQILHKLDSLSEEADEESIFLPLPGVLNFLKSFKSNFWTLGILTGNTSKRTLAKLGRSDINRYFNKNYVFSCHNKESRIDIAHRAQKFIKSHKINKVIIIGDTPFDILIAKEIGAKAVSVATGKFSISELSSFKPDLLIKNLQEHYTEFNDFLNFNQD